MSIVTVFGASRAYVDIGLTVFRLPLGTNSSEATQKRNCAIRRAITAGSFFSCSIDMEPKKNRVNLLLPCLNYEFSNKYHGRSATVINDHSSDVVLSFPFAYLNATCGRLERELPGNPTRLPTFLERPPHSTLLTNFRFFHGTHTLQLGPQCADLPIVTTSVNDYLTEWSSSFARTQPHSEFEVDWTEFVNNNILPLVDNDDSTLDVSHQPLSASVPVPSVLLCQPTTSATTLSLRQTSSILGTWWNSLKDSRFVLSLFH